MKISFAQALLLGLLVGVAFGVMIAMLRMYPNNLLALVIGTAIMGAIIGLVIAKLRKK